MAPKNSGTNATRSGLLMPLLVGLFLAAVAAGAGFWSVTDGPFAPADGPSDHTAAPRSDVTAPRPVDTVFVALEPMVISLGSAMSARHLMFDAHLEVPPEHVEEVSRLLPRVLDVLNSYLRVISLSELSEPTGLAVIRAQILRRIQVVTGPGRVQDLLVTQFVVN